MPTPLQERARIFREARDKGLTPTEAATMAVPGANPVMIQNFADVTGNLVNVDGFSIPMGVVAARFSAPGLGRRLAADTGIPEQAATDHMDRAVSKMPTAGSAPDYDRFDMMMTNTRRNTAGSITQTVANFKDVGKDIELAAAAGMAFPGNFQQALFGAVIGESPAAVAARLWPTADIGDSPENQQKKALIPMAIKGASMSLIGNIIKLGGAVSPIGGEIEGEAMIQKARGTLQPVLESDYNQNLISGSDILEHANFNAQQAADAVANGDPEAFVSYFSAIPDPGTPERQAYDQAVRDYAAENYAYLSTVKRPIGPSVIVSGLGIKIPNPTHLSLGDVHMAAMAIGGSFLDVFADPLLLTSDAPPAAVEAIRSALPASSRARVTAAIATKGKRLEDLLVASNDANKWAEKAMETYRKNPSEENLARLIHARKNAARVASMHDAGRMGGPGEAVVFNTNPKIRPEHIQPVGDAFLEAPSGAGWSAASDFIADQIKVARKEVQGLEKMVERAGENIPEGQIFTPEQLGENIDDLKKQLTAKKQDLDQWRTTGRWLKSRESLAANHEVDPTRTAAFFKEAMNEQSPYAADAFKLGPDSSNEEALRAVHNNIQRGLVQGAPQEEINQWQRTFSDIVADGAPVDGVIRRSELTPKQLLEDSRDATRRRVLSKSNEPIGDFRQADPGQIENRIAFGPDESESAGEAAAILASGGEIDDMSYYGMPLGMYNTSYGLRPYPHSGTEMRALEKTLTADNEWLGIGPVRTKVEAAEWQQNLGEKMGDFWAKGFYPRTWNLRPAAAIYKIREPMRLLQSAQPELYTRIHNAYSSQDFELARMYSIFRREMRNLGVHRVAGDVEYVDKAVSEKFFHLMNMDPTGEDYIAELAKLPESHRRSISNLRQEQNFIRDKLGLRNSDMSISGFIHHTFDPEMFANGARPLEFLGLPVSGDVFTPTLLNRSGSGEFIPDLSLALDIYARSAARKLTIEPVLKDLEFATKRIAAEKPEEQWLSLALEHIVRNMKGEPSNLGRDVDATMSSLNARIRANAAIQGVVKAAGKPRAALGRGLTSVGQEIEKVPGLGGVGGRISRAGIEVTDRGSRMMANGFPMYRRGDVGRTAMGVSSLVYSSVLTGSGRYFPMAVSTALATTGGRYGLFRTAESILRMGTADGRAMAKSSGVGRQWQKILESSEWSTIGRLASDLPSFNGATVVGPSISATENLIRGWTMHACLGDLMRKSGYSSWLDVERNGMAHAFMHEAVRTTEEVNHLFGVMGKPAGWVRKSKSGTAAATQFLSFVPKQTEELLSQAMRNPGHIGRYMMISGYLQRTASKAGMDISNYVGLGYLPKSPDEATSVIFDTIGSTLRMGGEHLAMMSEYGDEQRAQRATDEWLRSIESFIPYGIAIKRAATGYETLRTGSVFSGGRKVRQADLGEFKWDQSKSFIENWMQLPKGLVPADGSTAHPTELMALLSGLRSPQSQLEQQSYAARLEQQSRRNRQNQNLAEALDQAVISGDYTRYKKLLAQAIQSGLIDPVKLGGVQRGAMELAVPRLLLNQMRGDQQLLDSYEEDRRNLILYQLRFGREGGSANGR